MSTVIYLSNSEVRVIVGKRNGNYLCVDAAFRGNAPEGSIINGQVLNEEVFTNYLADFWEEHRLSGKDVTLVLGSARTVVKAVAVPQLPYRKIMAYLPHEFASSGSKKDSLYTYNILSKEKEKYWIFAGMTEREFLRQHILRFRKLGIKLGNVSVGMMANLKLIQRISHLKDKTCIIQMADGINLVSILLVQGKYRHFTSMRVFAPQGSRDFGCEIAKAVSTLRLFLYTQDIEKTITHVYFADGFRKEELKIYQESLRQIGGEIQADMIFGGEPELIRLMPGLAGETAEYYFTAVAGLLAERNRQNLIYQYFCSQERLRGQRKKLRKRLPAAALAFLLLGAVGIQTAEIVKGMEMLEWQFKIMDNTESMERIVRYESLSRENEELAAMIDVINDTQRNLSGYPVYTAKVRSVVEACAAGLGTAEIVKYDGESGEVTVEVSVKDAACVYRLADRLKEREDTFSDVYYSGFESDADGEVWRALFICRLAPPADTEEENGAWMLQSE